MRYKEKTVKLSQIDSKDDTFRITTEANIDDLMTSIKNVGLLNLPLLIKKNVTYTIVCGFRRIETCRRLGWSDLEARILASDTKGLECAKYAIIDNAFHRPLNLIEKSRAIEMLSVFIKDNSSLAKELPSLGLPENQAVTKKIKNLCHLSQPIQDSILSNTISLSMALELGKLTQDAGETFAKIFNLLKLSLNKQREIITLIKEIALREDVSIMDVLEDGNLQAILTNEDLDRNQKTRKIRIYLNQRRFPAVTNAQKKFEKHLNELKLGSGTKLIPPEHFEGTTYTLKLSFKNLIELKDRKTTIDAIIQNPSLKKILPP